MGFRQSLHEATIYRRGNGGNTLLVGVYVDDLVITGTKDVKVAVFKEEMKVTFQMSDMGLLSFYLGIEVHQGDTAITLRQTAYAKHVVELVGLTDYNPAHSDGGEAEAEPRQHDGGCGRYTIPASCGEPSLPRPHTVGLGILRRLR
jgi:hypothetical protein